MPYQTIQSICLANQALSELVTIPGTLLGIAIDFGLTPRGANLVAIDPQTGLGSILDIRVDNADTRSVYLAVNLYAHHPGTQRQFQMLMYQTEAFDRGIAYFYQEL